jgi:hypothetical protein
MEEKSASSHDPDSFRFEYTYITATTTNPKTRTVASRASVEKTAICSVILCVTTVASVVVTVRVKVDVMVKVEVTAGGSAEKPVMSGLALLLSADNSKKTKTVNLVKISFKPDRRRPFFV